MKHDRKRTAEKQATMYYCPPPSLRGDKTLSCPPGAPASMLQAKNKHKQTKTSTTGSATKKKQTTMTPRPHYVAANSLMSAWRTRFDVAGKKTKKARKTHKKLTASKTKQPCTPPPSLRLDKLSHVCLAHPLSGMRCDLSHRCSR